MISKWRWRPPADLSLEDWKVHRRPKSVHVQRYSGTWPGRPYRVGAAKETRTWERFMTKGICFGCGGDWTFSGGLKVDLNSSEYTGYRYWYKKPGYRIKDRSCEDARFLHINYILLAEVRHFEKVSAVYLKISCWYKIKLYAYIYGLFQKLQLKLRLTKNKTKCSFENTFLKFKPKILTCKWLFVVKLGWKPTLLNITYFYLK